MRFKIDENLPKEAVVLIASLGHDAAGVADEGLQGASDATLVARCLVEDRVLVTLDLDFADVRLLASERFPGVIVLRLSRQDKRRVLEAVERASRVLESEAVQRNVWIVEETRVRIRGPEQD